MNEKNDNANCLNEEPLITADQVCVYNQTVCLCLVFKCRETEVRGNVRLTLWSTPLHTPHGTEKINTLKLVFKQHQSKKYVCKLFMNDMLL